MINTLKTGGFAFLLCMNLLNPVVASDESGRQYEVSVTNLTQAQILSPFLVSAHKHAFPIYTLGAKASPELAAVAQDADTSGLEALLNAQSSTRDLVIADSVIVPGQTVSVTLSGKNLRYLNLASMLVTTNDAFIGLNSIRLRGRQMSFFVPAYDAGAENNDESCAYIPGPPCGNPGKASAEPGEGFVYTHPGIQAIGDLDTSFDWKNPTALIQIKRL